MASLPPFLPFTARIHLLSSWFVVLKPDHGCVLACPLYAHRCSHGCYRHLFVTVHINIFEGLGFFPSHLYQEKFLAHLLLPSCWWCQSVKLPFLNGLPWRDTAWSSICGDEARSCLLCIALQSFWIKSIRTEERVTHVHVAVGLEDSQGVAQRSGLPGCAHGKAHLFAPSSSPLCRTKEKSVFIRRLFHNILHGL